MSDNDKTLKNIFSDAYTELGSILKASKDGVVSLIKLGPEEKPPALEVDGEASSFRETCKDRSHGTRHSTQGEYSSNPMSHRPSTPFSPTPSVLSSLWTGPMPWISKDSPWVLIAIILLITKKDKQKNLYSTVYSNVPTKIIDNEAINSELYPS
jgi:hypothetical protein